MDGRKGQRYEVVTAPTTGGISSLTAGTLGTISGSSIFFSGSADGMTNALSTNVFLTICDDNSNESEEFIEIDGNALGAHIKLEQDQENDQEHDMSTSTIALSTSTLQPTIQYRLVNPLHQVQHNQIAPERELTTATTILPASVQLPSGCEIYLLKQYAETSPETTGAVDIQARQQTAALHSVPDIKLEPHMAKNDLDKMTTTSNVLVFNGVSRQTRLAASNCHAGNTLENVTSTAVVPVEVSSSHKRIVEAYKKRDDKRRATHNEVERRRRDKINHWIFKLKEMLPVDGASNNNHNNSNNSNGNNNNTSAAGLSSSSSNHSSNSTIAMVSSSGRTPPSDSKSQILIKACDYIKTMQTELCGLRECLSENERLRLKNQRLEDELDALRQQLYEQQTQHSVPSSSSFVTLNALNGSGDLFGGIDAATAVDFSKRELIIGIGDYVD